MQLKGVLSESKYMNNKIYFSHYPTNVSQCFKSKCSKLDSENYTSTNEGSRANCAFWLNRKDRSVKYSKLARLARKQQEVSGKCPSGCYFQVLTWFRHRMQQNTFQFCSFITVSKYNPHCVFVVKGNLISSQAGVLFSHLPDNPLTETHIQFSPGGQLVDQIVVFAVTRDWTGVPSCT